MLERRKSMLCLTACIVCDSHRTDEPKVPEPLCDMIAFWMKTHDVKALDFSLDEVSEDEQ